MPSSLSISRIAITSGEPAGICRDICVKLADCEIEADITFIGDVDMLKNRAHQLNIKIAFESYESTENSHQHVKNTLKVLHIPIAAPLLSALLP